jgi:hypothetical protein
MQNTQKTIQLFTKTIEAESIYTYLAGRLDGETNWSNWKGEEAQAFTEDRSLI